MISNPLQAAFGAFWAAMLLSWTLSPWADSAQKAMEDYSKLVFFYVILTTSIRGEDELRKVIVGFVVAMYLYMAHSYREFLCGRHVYRMGIARMVGVGESLSDPNAFSATILYALPMVGVVWPMSRAAWWRLGLISYVALSVVCIIKTGSRSAFVGLLCLGAMAVAKSHRRVRVAIAVAVLLPIAWNLIPHDLQNRFYTLIDPSFGPANAQVSAEGRKEEWKNGLILLGRYPISGCGPFVWIPATGSEIESHQLYGQVLGEMGLIGALSFGSVVTLLFWNVHRIKLYYRRNPAVKRDFLYRLADMISLSILILLLMGFGGHNLYRYSWLWYGGFLILAKQCLEEREDHSAEDPEAESIAEEAEGPEMMT